MTTKSRFQQQTADSATNLFEVVTPSDTVDLKWATRGLVVAVSGAVTVQRAHDGASVVLPSMPIGYLWPLSVTRVMATGTAGSGIVALY